MRYDIIQNGNEFVVYDYLGYTRVVGVFNSYERAKKEIIKLILTNED